MIPNKRNTSQKVKILEYLKGQRQVRKAEEVFAEVRKTLPAISLSTVYRNLNNLSSEGIISRIEVRGEFHYDADHCGKQYLVCRNCGKITSKSDIEVTESLLPNLTEKEFIPDCVQVLVYGKCKDCGGLK